MIPVEHDEGMNTAVEVAGAITAPESRSSGGTPLFWNSFEGSLRLRLGLSRNRLSPAMSTSRVFVILFRRRASPPPSAFEGDRVLPIRVDATDMQDLRVHVLMARATQEEAIRGRPSPAATPVPQMMHVITAAATTGATPAGIPAPDCRPDSPDRLGQLLAPLPLNDYAGFGLRHRPCPDPRHDQRPVAAIVRSTQTRTPGMEAALLSARTKPPNFV